MCELFSELSDNELESIAKLGRIEKFESGEKIYEQGCIGTKLYILSEGRVTLERKVDLGGHRVANITVFCLERANKQKAYGRLVCTCRIATCSDVLCRMRKTDQGHFDALLGS